MSPEVENFIIKSTIIIAVLGTIAATVVGMYFRSHM